MKARGRETEGLRDGWTLCEVHGGVDDPAALDARTPAWIPARVPGTAAQALAAAGAWTIDDEKDFDASDWWFRCRFEKAAPTSGRVVLHLGGLATVADVFLNGTKVLSSDNMFHAHDVDVTAHLRGDNQLDLRFHALKRLLGARKGRPRWRTRLVEQQQLRWFRTTLLGRMPGWNPRVAPVGPYREISLREERGFTIESIDVRPRVEADRGAGDVAVRVRGFDEPLPPSVTLAISRAGTTERFHVPARTSSSATADYATTFTLRDLPTELWWPHTHGAQPLYDVQLFVGDTAVPLSRIGFRTVELHTADDDFQLRTNGVPIFCRGAVWTTSDILSLDDPARAKALVKRAHDTGMNMLRVPGIGAYESDAFYNACDEMGVMVFQEMAFANMDYPATDAAFVASVKREADELGARLQGRPSLSLWCGGSEVEQQAAMLGLPRQTWSNAIFQTVLPEALRARCPDVPYTAASPGGGPLPFVVNKGLAHYYGVGAYLRPLSDARLCGVRFAAECLAFANVPEPDTVELTMKAGGVAPTHPDWKARVPRDRGVGWDFEDVRDHYVQRLFNVDPVAVRYSDPERYLTLGRLATGEVMARTFAEWRRRGSTCNGALVFTFQDVWPGAGWGVIDSTGAPKAAYHHLRRALAKVALSLIDEGASGLDAHVVNDTAHPVTATLHVTLWRYGRQPVARAEAVVTAAPRAVTVISVDEHLGSFLDTTYAYRFGPPGFDVVTARLTDDRGTVLSRATHFPLGLPVAVDPDLTITAHAQPSATPGVWTLTVESNHVCVGAFIEARGFEASDNHLTLAPGDPQTVELRAMSSDATKPVGSVQACSSPTPSRITS